MFNGNVASYLCSIIDGIFVVLQLLLNGVFFKYFFFIAFGGKVGVIRTKKRWCSVTRFPFDSNNGFSQVAR